MKLIIILFALPALCGLSACGAKDSDKIGDAQYCLDTSTASTVGACVDKVAGLETPGAYVIRCAANFIQKGFGEPAQIVDTFKNLDNSGSSTTTAFLAALNFADASFAKQTYSYCLKTNQKGLSMLAAMVQSATSLASLGSTLGGACSSSSSSASDIQSCISNLVSDYNSSGSAGQEAATTVGQTVLDVYQSSCQTGSQVNSSLCDQMNTAISSAGATDAASIGAALIQAWASQ